MNIPPSRFPSGAQASADLPAASRVEETVARIEDLASELSARGWVTRLHTPADRLPSLYVQNPDPDAVGLSEYIYAGPDAGGTWAYWWPWADRIASATSDAADTITRVLRVSETGDTR